MSKGLRVLLIDDDPDDRALVLRQLTAEFPEVEVEQILDAAGLEHALRSDGYDLVITDYAAGWTDGLAVLGKVRARNPECPVIMFTGTGSEEIAVEAMKQGLDDYVIKSAKHFVRLPVAVRSVLEKAYHREALKISEVRYRTLFEGVPIGLYRVSTNGEILDANPACYQMLGFPDLESFRKVNATELYFDAEERRKLTEVIEQRGVVRDYEIRLRRRDGEIRWIRDSAHAVKDSEGRVLYYEGSLEDVSERRGAEEQLRLAQRMEAIGRLAGGVAHDFNNLLTIIGGYGDLLRDAVSAEATLKSHVDTLMGAVGRAATLTRQLLAFGRKQVLEAKTVSLNGIVQEMEGLLRRLLGADIELVIELHPSLGSVRVDPSQIEQVIMNLAVNSRDAMPDGGRLLLQTAEVALDHAYDGSRFRVEPGPYVMLSVGDTGHGMDAETMERIFEPFFTTKPKDKGTGLGLSTVYGIVKQSGGYIYVDSRPGAGATFKIYFPRVYAEAEDKASPVETSTQTRGSETVLVCEDEEGIRDLVREVLGLNGYTVIAASDAREALKLANGHRGRIDLLLTDVVMPGMSGRELVGHLRSVRPDTKILYMSGYTADGVLRQDIQDSEAAFLQKPFTPDGLLAKAREVLGDVSQSGVRGTG